MRKAMEKLEAADPADPGAVLKTVAMALVSSVGGAAGPLYGTLFLQMGGALAGQERVDLPGWTAAWRAALEGVQARGKAQPGDKTMVDALIPAIEALEGASDLDEGLRAAAQGAEEGMRATIAARRPQGPRQLPRRAQQGPPGSRRDVHLLPLQERRRGAGRLKGENRMAKYAAALDQGTTSSRAMVFNHEGRVESVAQKEHEQIYPKPGWVEHDAKEIWARSQEVLDEALEAAGASIDDVAGLGITNQRETTVVWDRNTGEPIHNALVWQDTRTDKIVDELSADGGQARFQEKVGLPLATYFSGPKVRWILDNVDGARDRAEAGDLAFGNMDTWLHLEPHRRHRRRPAHHRCDERQPHDADGPQDPLVGRGDRRHHRRADLDAPGDPRLERGLRRGQDRRLHRHPDRRRPRRPAGGHLRPGLPVAGRGEEHLRHRQLPAAQHGHGGGAVQERHAHDRGLQDRRQRRDLLPGGRDRDHRGARAVAARQPQADQGGARGRGARAVGRGQRRPVHRAGLLGPVRAVLEVQRPRRVRGPDALRQRRPHRPRDAGGHGLPEPRGRRGDEPGLGRRRSSR